MTRQQRDKILPTSQGDRAGERLPSTESWTDLAKKYALMTTGAGTGTTLSAYLSLGYWILVIVPVIHSTQGSPFEAAHLGIGLQEMSWMLRCRASMSLRNKLGIVVARAAQTYVSNVRSMLQHASIGRLESVFQCFLSWNSSQYLAKAPFTTDIGRGFWA